MAGIDLTFSDSFGYYPASTISQLKEGEEGVSELFEKINILNVTGYLPIVAGAIRVYTFVKIVRMKWKESIIPTKIFFTVQIIRGIVEFLGAGLLFLIPDLIATIGRANGKWELA